MKSSSRRGTAPKGTGKLARARLVANRAVKQGKARARSAASTVLKKTQNVTETAGGVAGTMAAVVGGAAGLVAGIVEGATGSNREAPIPVSGEDSL